MKDTFKLGFKLAIFTAISCTVLSVVNSFTAPVIEAHATEKANAALSVVFKDADKFTPVDNVTKGNKDVDGLTKYMKESLVTLDALYIAYKGDEVVGAVTQVDGPTYDHSTIMVGIDMNRTLTGISILETTDSPGYGQKALNPAFYEQFAGIDASKTLVNDQDFDGISGATISSRGYADLLNFAVYIAAGYLADNYNGLSGSSDAPVVKKSTEDLLITVEDAISDIFGTDVTTKKIETLPVIQNSNTTIEQGFEIYNGDTLSAVAFEMSGKLFAGQGIITVAIGTDGIIKGIRINETHDTPNYGLKALEESFWSQYTGKSANGKLSLSDDIDAISGATITSKAITDLVNSAATAYTLYSED
jgi:electron transport complex protein RnfG